MLPGDSATGVPNVNQGLDAPVRPITQTQATGGPGRLTQAQLAAAQQFAGSGSGLRSNGVIASPDLAAPPANTQIGVGAPGEDSGQAKTPNATQQEINTIFSNSPITPLPNVLDQYASYTYGVSLYLTTKEAYTTMVSTGRKNLTGCALLMQSAGIPTGSRTPYFGNDYYIETVKLQSKIMGKGTGSGHNVVDIDFTITEPTGITLIPNLTKAAQQFYPDVAADFRFQTPAPAQAAAPIPAAPALQTIQMGGGSNSNSNQRIPGEGGSTGAPRPLFGGGEQPQGYLPGHARIAVGQ
jgi:hypothetical protein